MPIIRKKALVHETTVDDLADIGLSPTTPVATAKVVSTNHPVLHIGTRVIINHALFPWNKSYTIGEIGTVIKITQNNDRTVSDFTRYDIIDVELDTPKAGKKIVGVSRWELDIYNAKVGSI